MDMAQFFGKANFRGYGMRNAALARLILPIIAAIALAACGVLQTPAKEQAFKQFFQTDDVNDSLEMEVLAQEGTFSPDDSIDFVLENTSNDPIVLPHAFGARGFYYEPETQSWIELENLIEYYPERQNLISPKGGSLSDRMIVGFDPDEDGVDLPIKLRVVVYGRFYRNDEVTDEMVAAFAEAKITE